MSIRILTACTVMVKSVGFIVRLWDVKPSPPPLASYVIHTKSLWSLNLRSPFVKRVNDEGDDSTDFMEFLGCECNIMHTECLSLCLVCKNGQSFVLRMCF